jgi:hypothetical protein
MGCIVSEPWIVGQVARLPLQVLDNASLPVDPGAVLLKLKVPAGTVTTYTYGAGPEIVRDAAGAYHADLVLSAAGVWTYRWELGAPNAGAAEGVIRVNKSVVI